MGGTGNENAASFTKVVDPLVYGLGHISHS